MTPDDAAVLRRAAAHVVVADVDFPSVDEASDHHVRRVLRVRPGDVVTVTDGVGGWRVCRLTGDGLEPDGDPVVEPEPPDPVTIAFAIPKLDRPEWIVQKLTELGVDRIVLLHAERSVVRWDDSRAAKHLAKLRRVALEAVQQSRRVRTPVIDGPMPAARILPTARAAEPGSAPIVSTDRVIAIGPEGGWSDDELAVAAGTVGLGPTVLRVETATLVAATRALAHRR